MLQMIDGLQGDQEDVARETPRLLACVIEGGVEPVTGTAGLGKDRGTWERMNQSLNKYLSSFYCVPYSNAGMGQNPGQTRILVIF